MFKRILNALNMESDPITSEFFQKGVQQMRVGAYENAIANFSEVIARQPQNFNAYSNRATCGLSTGSPLPLSKMPTWLLRKSRPLPIRMQQEELLSMNLATLMRL